MEVCPVSCLVSKQQGLPANSSTDAMSFYRYFFSKYEIKCEIDVTFNKCVCLNADGPLITCKGCGLLLNLVHIKSFHITFAKDHAMLIWLKYAIHSMHAIAFLKVVI